jgi:hypothetical protein
MGSGRPVSPNANHSAQRNASKICRNVREYDILSNALTESVQFHPFPGMQLIPAIVRQHLDVVRHIVSQGEDSKDGLAIFSRMSFVLESLVEPGNEIGRRNRSKVEVVATGSPVFRRHVHHQADVGAGKDIPDILMALDDGANLGFRGDAKAGHQRRKLIDDERKRSGFGQGLCEPVQRIQRIGKHLHLPILAGQKINAVTDRNRLFSRREPKRWLQVRKESAGFLNAVLRTAVDLEPLCQQLFLEPASRCPSWFPH